MKRVIIDTDCGSGVSGADIDDALAIAVALLSPDVDLLGITTMTANIDVEDVTASVLQLLEIAGRDVPVCVGAARPMIADPTPIRQRVEARATSELAQRLWAKVPRPAPSGKTDPRPAADFLVDTIMAHPGEITLVPIGSFTNVALALQLEPRLASAVKSVVLMGGSIRAPFGVLAPGVEFNAGYDPEATAILFRSGAPITMVPLDVTTRVYLHVEDLDKLRRVGTPLTEYLALACEPWIRLQMEWRRLPGCWLHDPLAMCVVLDPTIVQMEPMHVDVELASPQYRGQTVGWDPAFPYILGRRAANAQVCMDVDAARFKTLLFGVLGVKK
jgi:inosine-uridine nucleoside N-ribohydrolase